MHIDNEAVEVVNEWEVDKRKGRFISDEERELRGIERETRKGKLAIWLVSEYFNFMSPDEKAKCRRAIINKVKSNMGMRL